MSNTNTENTTSQKIVVRACSIENIQHPEWGTFGVAEDNGDHFVIRNGRGSRVLSKSEADRFWKMA